MEGTINSSVSSPVPAVPPKKADDPRKVHDAAQQFEALMIAQMLKSMRDAGAGLTDGEEDTGNSTALEMAEVEFAKALSQRGGLGLAHMVESGLQSRAAASSPKPQKLNE